MGVVGPTPITPHASSALLMSALIYTQMEVRAKKGDGWAGKIISDDVRLGRRRNGLCCDDAGAAPKAGQPTESMLECRQPLCGATVPQRRGEKEWSIIIEESHSGEVVISITIFLVSYLDSPLQPHLTVSSVLVTRAKSNIQLLNSLNNDSYSLAVCVRVS